MQKIQRFNWILPDRETSLILPDREVSLIKKDYCRLSVFPSLPASDFILELVLTLKGQQANSCPSLVTQGVSRSGQERFHCTLGTVPSYRRSSLVAPLHFKGRGRETRYWSRWLANQKRSPEVGGYLVLHRRVAWATTTWAHASARRWGETWARSIKIPRFVVVLGGRAFSIRAPGSVGGTLGCGVGLLSLFFFSTSIQKNLIKKEYCRL